MPLTTAGILASPTYDRIYRKSSYVLIPLRMPAFNMIDER